MIYLAHTAADAPQVLTIAGVDDVFELTERLFVVDTTLSRSQLYHRLKPMQAKDAPLLVAELTEAPKIKGTAPGSTTWLSHRFP